jgi:hypothetical protein
MSKEISNFVIPAKPTGRFIQPYIITRFNRVPFIRFSLNDDETHDDILTRLLTEYHWSVGMPAFKYESSGKGFYKTLKDGTIQLYGDAFNSNVSPNQKNLDDLAPYLPKGTKIEIREDN